MSLRSTALRIPAIGLAAGVAVLSFSADLRGEEAPAPAEGALRGMLEAVPAYFMTDDMGYVSVHFVDHEAAALSAALAGMEEHGVWAGPNGGALRANLSTLSWYVTVGTETQWSGQVGFELRDLRQSLELSPPWETYLLFRLRPGVAEGIGPVLEANGYEARADAPYPAWGRGEDGTTDLENRDRRHLFSGGVGLSSRVGIMGDMVVQGPVWEPVLAFMSEGQPSIAEDPAMAALLEGVEASGLPVVQAFIPLSPDLTPARREVPWTAAALIDRFTDTEHIGQVVLVFPDADAARDAAAHIAGAWESEPSTVFDGSFADRTGWQPEFELVGEGPTVLVMTLAADPDWSSLAAPNRAYDTLYRAVMRGDMVFLPRS